jgi:hypothetical protein
VFDEGGNLKEVLARLHDLDAARAAYTPRERTTRGFPKCSRAWSGKEVARSTDFYVRIEGD